MVMLQQNLRPATACIIVWILTSSSQRLMAQSPLNVVQAAMSDLRNKSVGWEFQLEAVIMQEFSAFQDKNPNQSTAFNPHSPLTLESTEQLLIHIPNGAFRWECRRPVESEDGLIPSFSIWLGDGRQAQLLHPEPSQTGRRLTAYADVTPNEVIPTLNSFAPVFWSLGILRIPDYLQTTETDLSSLGGEWSVEDSIIHWKYALQKTQIHFQFDTQIGCRVVKCSMGNRPRSSDIAPSDESTAIVEYRNVGETPQLHRWEFTIPSALHRSYEVIRATPLQVIDTDRFRPPEDYLKPGMRIMKERKPFIVDEAGSLSPFRNGESAQTHNRWTLTRWNLFVAVIILVCLGVRSLWKKIKTS